MHAAVRQPLCRARRVALRSILPLVPAMIVALPIHAAHGQCAGCHRRDVEVAEVRRPRRRVALCHDCFTRAIVLRVLADLEPIT